MLNASNVTGKAALLEIDSELPANIILTNKDSFVQVNWEVSGILADMVGGTWRLNLFLESLGGGPELEVAKKDAPALVMPGPGPASYSEKIKLAAGTIPAGTYKPTITITYIGEDGKAWPIAAFFEGPILQFYDAHTEPPTSWPEPG